GTTGEQPRSSRPGQAGFAQRLMSKYGWSKGSGLGADESGIVSALHVQVQKRKKKPDSEGGGFVDPQAIGKIVGGKRKPVAGEEGEGGKFGAMSEVVVLEGMVDGMDLDDEVGAGDGGIMQEIGEECGEKYGNVERVFIHRRGGLPWLRARVIDWLGMKALWYASLVKTMVLRLFKSSGRGRGDCVCEVYEPVEWVEGCQCVGGEDV
ncbi:hypothetical protein V491_02087, partial [Pseudogymnoascus sp. VKM F-3775]